jgi:hypothetical protein
MGPYGKRTFNPAIIVRSYQFAHETCKKLKSKEIFYNNLLVANKGKMTWQYGNYEPRLRSAKNFIQPQVSIVNRIQQS